MYLIRNHQKLPESLQHAIVTIGNFDGVHLGHQQLLKALKARAQELNKPCGVIVFEPQPAEFFMQAPPPRLTSLRQKYQLIKQQGIDFILVLRFNASLAELSAQDFIAQVLVKQLNIHEIWVGQDFRFGHQRLGDLALLKNEGQHLGFSVKAMPDITIEGVRISSTQIRNLLAQGELHLARHLLGRFFSIAGKVIPGAARGRVLDMRTANINPTFQHVPFSGIFVVRVACKQQEWPGVASLGFRPVFSGQHILLEVHIFNFAQDIYGEHLNVEFLHKLRDEKNFETVEFLQQQMQQDLLDAQHYWKQHYDEL
ncbi:MAG: bifunctional riboflavin kinase/FAD synthetase [Legionellales bacterium]|jgi:riboflavin kinase/FMN adenylyltransferase